MDKQKIFLSSIAKAEKEGYVRQNYVWTSKDDIPANAFSIIFSHDFAKAFWGEGKYKRQSRYGAKYFWQYSLQQMVISDNPIKYLEQFI